MIEIHDILSVIEVTSNGPLHGIAPMHLHTGAKRALPASGCLPAGETCGQLLIFSSFSVSLLLATRTLRDGSSTGVSSIFRDDSDLEFTNTTVKAEMKCDWRREEATGELACRRPAPEGETHRGEAGVPLAFP